MRNDINSLDSVVSVNGEDFMVMTGVDENGNFWTSDEDGGDHQFHFENVDHVVVKMAVDLDEENEDQEFVDFWHECGFDVDGV